MVTARPAWLRTCLRKRQRNSSRPSLTRARCSPPATPWPETAHETRVHRRGGPGVGQAPTPAQIRNIETRLARSMRAEAAADPQAWLALPLADQLQAAAQRATTDIQPEIGRAHV